MIKGAIYRIKESFALLGKDREDDDANDLKRCRDFIKRALINREKNAGCVN